MNEYRVYLNDELLCKADWPSIAAAAWDRASPDRDSAQHGGKAVLMKDGVVLASEQPRTQHGHPWPDPATPEPGPRDVSAAIQQLARAAGIDVRALADEMTAQGLPTTRGRLDGTRTLEEGKRAHVSDAELVAMCYAAATLVRKEGGVE